MEPNWSELERQLAESPTNLQCYNHGVSHRGYGWGSSPWGHWTEEQKAYYRQGLTGQPFAEIKS
jgi:hypothetical protein